MRPSVQGSSLLISLVLLIISAVGVRAQVVFPQEEGGKATMKCIIEMPKAYVSGLCILRREGETVKGSIFNEFGISAMDFTYRIDKDKVKLHTVVKMMDKWYIRRTLKADLREVMKELRRGGRRYENKRNRITYTFDPIERGGGESDGSR